MARDGMRWDGMELDAMDGWMGWIDGWMDENINAMAAEM